jgi:ATP-binding cassette, subfamily G (WHITE), member 2, SNQ2
MFDKVAVIYSGKMAYFGPADRAREYFEEMGWEGKERQTTPEFLVAVTDPLGRVPRKDLEEKEVMGLPKTAEEFAEYFRRSEIGELNREDMEKYRKEHVGHPEEVERYKESALAEQARNACRRSPYTMSVGMQVREVMRRRVGIISGNWGGVVTQAV